MKNIFLTLATMAALLSFTACNKENADSSSDLEFRAGFEFPKDVTDNFDLVYDISIDGKSIANGTMSGNFKPITIKNGIKEGTFVFKFNMKAKESLYKNWDLEKEYVIAEKYYSAFYSTSKGKEKELIKIESSMDEEKYSAPIEEWIERTIQRMESVMSYSNEFKIEKSKGGYSVTYIY